MLAAIFGPVVYLDDRKYKILRQLGEGAFGYVYEVRGPPPPARPTSPSSTSTSSNRDSSSKHYALKKILCQTPEAMQQARLEVEVMLGLQHHPNILSVLDFAFYDLSAEKKSSRLSIFGRRRPTTPEPNTRAESPNNTIWGSFGGKRGRPLSWKKWQNDDNRMNNQNLPSKVFGECYILMPLMYSSVQSIIDLAQVNWPYCAFQDGLEVVSILRGTIEGILALHQYGYRHGDIKPANILVSPDLSTIKLTDFGSVMPISMSVLHRTDALKIQDCALTMSTASYRAPELYSPATSTVIDGKADVWAFGCLMYVLFFSRNPFELPIEGLSILNLMSGQYPLPNVHPWPNDYMEVLAHCLEIDPRERITSKELQILLRRLSSPPLDILQDTMRAKGIDVVLVKPTLSCTTTAVQDTFRSESQDNSSENNSAMYDSTTSAISWHLQDDQSLDTIQLDYFRPTSTDNRMACSALCSLPIPSRSNSLSESTYLPERDSTFEQARRMWYSRPGSTFSQTAHRDRSQRILRELSINDPFSTKDDDAFTPPLNTQQSRKQLSQSTMSQMSVNLQSSANSLAMSPSLSSIGSKECTGSHLGLSLLPPAQNLLKQDANINSPKEAKRLLPPLPVSSSISTTEISSPPQNLQVKFSHVDSAVSPNSSTAATIKLGRSPLLESRMMPKLPTMFDETAARCYQEYVSSHTSPPVTKNNPNNTVTCTGDSSEKSGASGKGMNSEDAYFLEGEVDFDPLSMGLLSDGMEFVSPALLQSSFAINYTEDEMYESFTPITPESSRDWNPSTTQKGSNHPIFDDSSDTKSPPQFVNYQDTEYQDEIAADLKKRAFAVLLDESRLSSRIVYQGGVEVMLWRPDSHNFKRKRVWLVLTKMGLTIRKSREVYSTFCASMTFLAPLTMDSIADDSSCGSTLRGLALVNSLPFSEISPPSIGGSPLVDEDDCWIRVHPETHFLQETIPTIPTSTVKNSSFQPSVTEQNCREVAIQIVFASPSDRRDWSHRIYSTWKKCTQVL